MNRKGPQMVWKPATPGTSEPPRGLCGEVTILVPATGDFRQIRPRYTDALKSVLLWLKRGAESLDWDTSNPPQPLARCAVGPAQGAPRGRIPDGGVPSRRGRNHLPLRESQQGPTSHSSALPSPPGCPHPCRSGDSLPTPFAPPQRPRLLLRPPPAQTPKLLVLPSKWPLTGQALEEARRTQLLRGGLPDAPTAARGCRHTGSLDEKSKLPASPEKPEGPATCSQGSPGPSAPGDTPTPSPTPGGTSLGHPSPVGDPHATRTVATPGQPPRGVRSERSRARPGRDQLLSRPCGCGGLGFCKQSPQEESTFRISASVFLGNPFLSPLEIP